MVQLSKTFDLFSSKYENFIVLGGFNAEMANTHMEEFCSVYNLKNLIKDPTCYKNPEKPITIDHILTNHLRCFQYFGVYETGLSDFHRHISCFESIPFQRESYNLTIQISQLY